MNAFSSKSWLYLTARSFRLYSGLAFRLTPNFGALFVIQLVDGYSVSLGGVIGLCCCAMLCN